MSTAQALRNLERDLGAELDRDMNVVALKKPTVSRYVAPDPENEQERLASANRKAITIRKQRIADTKKGLKATLASIAAARKEEKARHDTALADLAERETEAKAQAARDIEADQKIVSSCEAALEILTAE